MTAVAVDAAAAAAAFSAGADAAAADGADDGAAVDDNDDKDDLAYEHSSSCFDIDNKASRTVVA